MPKYKIYKAIVKKTDNKSSSSKKNTSPTTHRKFKQIPPNEYDVDDIDHYDIEMLKKIVIFLDKKNDDLLKSIGDVERKNQRIEDENEQLRKRIIELEQL